MENEIDRRSGVDSRTPEEKLELGERRECSDRRAPRRRILKGVRIGFGNDFCSVEGVMSNISDTGALIKLQDGLLIPDEFMIHNELDGYKVSCRVVRRTGNTIGVRFIDEKQPIDAKKH